MPALRSHLVSWLLRLIAAGLLLQTLFFKFSAAAESVYIFGQLGVEPWGRIATGVLELAASLLLLLPRTTVLGALLASALMAGALLAHFFVLGISVQNDGGQLFAYALIILAAALMLFWIHRYGLGRFIPARFLPSFLQHT